MKLIVPVLSLLVACRAEPAVPSANGGAANGEEAGKSAASEKLSITEAFAFEEETELYGLKYSWPAEVSAIPVLADRFTRDMERARADLDAESKKDRDERTRLGFEFHPYETQVSYDTAGQSDRLLSLEKAVYRFTGGAHGSSGSGTVLWDRRLARELSLTDLLQPGRSWTGAIRQPFCTLLNREREERRGEPVSADDLFGDCPKYEDLTVLLSDADKNGRFDHIRVIADQYVAGPYAEGPYEIDLPITAAMIERSKSEYRPSFEHRPPVR